MADRIHFNSINDSLQIGDIAFVVITNANNIVTPIELGPVIEIGETSIVVDTAVNELANLGVLNNLQNSMFLFRKDSRANLSTLLGYFAEVHLELTNTDIVVQNDQNGNITGVDPTIIKNELFSIGSEVFISSK
tara:strand:+ start:1427 stop:1828 length:402 start_codon:yes stop_codon:yes gene_type:complete